MMNETCQFCQTGVPRPVTWAARTAPTLRDRVMEAMAEAVDSGLRPTEVFLGPEETAELIDYGTSLSFDLMQDTFVGLKVRRMTEPGVRVGTTFTGRDEE
jgi:hypothetical protein